MKARLSVYLSCALLLFFAACTRQKGLPSLDESFDRTGNDPFAARVAWNNLGRLFYHNEQTVQRTPFERALRQNRDSGSVLLSVSRSLYLSKGDVEALLDFLYRGNHALIAAGYFDSSLLRAFSVERPDESRMMGDWWENLQVTSVRLHPPHYEDSAEYSYYYLPFIRHFTHTDNPRITVLGTNRSGYANFIRVTYGQGTCYLHCEPRVFSNYFLLQGNNQRYLQELVAYLPAMPEHVYWNEYYNRRNRPPKEESGSGLSVLFRYPAMAAAAWLAILAGGLYLLFGSKRRRRIIPEQPVNRNSTVEFVDTISSLYLQQPDNRAMADKMISHFFEHIRHRYHLQPQGAGPEFVATLSHKAGIPEAETAALWEQIRQARMATTFSDQQLLQLNRYLEQFYKNNA